MQVCEVTRVEPSGWERCIGMCGWLDGVDGASGDRRVFEAAKFMHAVF